MACRSGRSAEVGQAARTVARRNGPAQRRLGRAAKGQENRLDRQCLVFAVARPRAGLHASRKRPRLWVYPTLRPAPPRWITRQPAHDAKASSTREPRRIARDRVLAWLDGRTNYERVPAAGNPGSTFGLARMRRLLDDPRQPTPPLSRGPRRRHEGEGLDRRDARRDPARSRAPRGPLHVAPRARARGADLRRRRGRSPRPTSSPRSTTVMPAVERSTDGAARRRNQCGPTWFEVHDRRRDGPLRTEQGRRRRARDGTRRQARRHERVAADASR